MAITCLATNLVNERTGTHNVPDEGVAALVEAILLAVGVGVCKCEKLC
jgi:hydroxymethylpyrimidine/phosphomethylpyrimidine kinase